MTTRKPYPSDVSDEEWAFVAPYLALVGEDAPQRNHDLREVLNGLRWIVRTGGSAWRYMPHDLPPWEAVYQQTQRWLQAGVFEEMVHDLRVVLRLWEGRERPILRQPYWTPAPCNPPRRAALGAATPTRSARKVRRYTRRWIHWDTSARLACDTSQRAGARACGRVSPECANRPRASRWDWHTWTKDIPQRGQLPKRRLMV
jgi:transposase